MRRGQDKAQRFGPKWGVVKSLLEWIPRGVWTLPALSDGSLLSDLAWYCGNNASSETDSAHGTKPVAQKVPNDFGLYDMNGNGWEWGHDWHTLNLFYDPVTDPQGLDSGYFKVLRGGHWAEPARQYEDGWSTLGYPRYGDAFFFDAIGSNNTRYSRVTLTN